MTQQPYAILCLLFSLGVCGLLYGIFTLRREKVFLPWLATWGLLAVHFAFALLFYNNGSPAAWIADRWTSLLAALGLLYAAREYAERPRRLAALGGVALLSLTWTILHVQHWRLFGEENGPMWLGAGLALWASATFWRARRIRGSLAVQLLAAVSVVWCLLNLAPAVVPRNVLDPNMPLLLTLSVFNLLMMAAGMLILASDAVLKRVEDNMMSFSVLNLGTTGQQTDADLARMIEKVLERVLDVYSVPRGLIVVHPGDRAASTRFFRGWPAGFAEEWQRRALEERLSASVARMGGLVAVPRLDDPGALSLLDVSTTDVGSNMVDMLRSAGVRSLIAVSLRTQKRTYGALLLAPPTWSIYTRAELRLLTSLGVQVGMGVENFLLMKSASRRSEELNLLNQTGRAISSTLESDVLLRRIHEELQKLMDAGNFYFARYEEVRQEIHFELEAEGGRYLPQRSRKLGRGLSEYILTTQQTVLIRSAAQMTEFLQRHNLGASGRPALSWCGAPVMIRGRAIGVMAVQSYERENAYDEDHLEVLRIVAAQAAVALENARLFAGEQEQLRQLTFLHSIARIAISTRNTEDMLAEIAREIEKNFGYEHIGIGLLDYEAKLVEWKAEAGTSPIRLADHKGGRKSSLDAGLIGRVTRSGKAVLVAEASGDYFSGMFENSRSGACLPIVYAEQMFGVLNIESEKPSGLREEDLPILKTMAGHLATALHNAFTFERTQEQAITDGLTGVKTHRYFMEALNGEWKRATRSGRVFSLLVLDLDRFKQVNDTLGHLEGDLVLVRLGRILEERCRKSNVVARYGGDEFMVLMPETTTDQAHKLADRLRLWIATDPLFAERRLTASFGVSTYPYHGHTPEEIIRVADAGMYIAKHQGGNHVAVAEQFRREVPERDEDHWQTQVFTPLLEGLRKGIEPTGPEALERLIQRLDDAWQTQSGDPSELSRSLEKGLTDLADLMEERVNAASGHQVHVMRYAMLLAGSMGLPEGKLQQVRLAARLHDVGYLAIPGEVLLNRGRLSQQEFSAVHVHAGAGARLLQAARLPAEVCEMVRHHHEFVNGRGYPDGLPGDRIPMGARILAIADAFNAITSERPYRPARSAQDALDEMERFAGSQFDEPLVRTFVGLMKTSQEIPS